MARVRRSLWCMPELTPANMTAVSVGPIVTNSVTKLDRRLEGTDLSTDRDYRNDLQFVTATAVEARMSLRRKSVSLFPAYLAASQGRARPLPA